MQMSIDSNISVLSPLGCTKFFMKDSTFPMTTQTCRQPNWSMTGRFSGRWEPFCIKHASYHSGIYDRKASGRSMVPGSVSLLSTTTISSSPVSWWCCWPSSCTCCGYAEFTTDKLEPQPRWTYCGSRRWCPWLGQRWGPEARQALGKLQYPRVAIEFRHFLVSASGAVLPDFVDIRLWNLNFNI